MAPLTSSRYGRLPAGLRTGPVRSLSASVAPFFDLAKVIKSHLGPGRGRQPGAQVRIGTEVAHQAVPDSVIGDGPELLRHGGQVGGRARLTWEPEDQREHRREPAHGS